MISRWRVRGRSRPNDQSKWTCKGRPHRHTCSHSTTEHRRRATSYNISLEDFRYVAPHDAKSCTREYHATLSAATMSLKTPEMANNTAEPLRIWNCIECRRRKVRCDRRHPCTPCIKNSVDCVFPVSGRVPRRSRDANGSQVQKQAELVGRLRRLEAMVGGLGSKIENVTKTPQGYQSVGDSDVTADSTSNDPSWADLDTTANTIANASQPDHMPADPVELRVNLNGDLVVGKGFWTIFCKEVSLLDSRSVLWSDPLLTCPR